MVLKLFDLFHQSSIDLIYILAHYFDKIHIVKPFTSRAANSEKYIVCKNFKGINQDELNQLYNIVEELSIISKQNKYVNRIISNDIPDEFIHELCNQKYLRSKLKIDKEGIKNFIKKL